MTDHPWLNEPDSLDFEAEGLPCAMRRNGHGVWCGYVGVGRDHPLYGLPTNHPLKLPASWFEGRRLFEGSSPLDLFVHMLGDAPVDTYQLGLAFQVHGGVNFADHGESLLADYWWFGFDCGHAGDYSPRAGDMNKIMGEMIDTMPEDVRAKMREIVFRETGVYRDQQYVVAECQSLASQLNAIVDVIAEKSPMREIVKVQMPLAATVSSQAAELALVYAKGRARMVQQMLDAATMAAIGTDPKAYFEAEFCPETGRWTIGKRTANQEW